MSVESGTAVASSSASSTLNAVRTEAGPLPSKRGEIGFNEQVHGRIDAAQASVTELPERHPADRDAPASAPPATIASVAAEVPSSSTSDTDSSSTNSLKKKKHCLWSCSSGKPISYGGILLKTLLQFFLQLAILGGTIAGWVITVQATMRGGLKLNSNSDATAGPTSVIFIHVVFAVAVVGQLLFIERRVFLIRAERYAHVHPGQILPSFRNRGHREDPSMGLSPWNRPPLPTYAAALAQSGHGTGDVEDHIIAQPPPPAYGNTRGSTMILAGFLRNSLLAQRPVSQHTVLTDSQLEAQPNERPLSYASQDDEWEVIQDAQRAQQLEETLARLERPSGRA